MSAVAASPVSGHGMFAAAAHEAQPAFVRSHEAEAAEQKRWLVWFGFPALVAAVLVGLVFATGQEYFLGLAIASIVFDIGVLVWLSLSSDTNGLIGAAASHH